MQMRVHSEGLSKAAVRCKPHPDPLHTEEREHEGPGMFLCIWLDRAADVVKQDQGKCMVGQGGGKPPLHI